MVRFLTASVSIPGHDRLNREVLNWLGARVLGKRGSRILTATSETIHNDAWHWRRVSQERNDFYHGKRPPVQYLPTFGTTIFYWKRSIFMVKRVMTGSSHYNSSWSHRTPEEYAGAPEGDEPWSFFAWVDLSSRLSGFSRNVATLPTNSGSRISRCVSASAHMTRPGIRPFRDHCARSRRSTLMRI